MPRATLYTRVSPETKRLAVEAAEQAGVPLNVWITNLILAEVEATRPSSPEPLPGQGFINGETLDWVETLTADK